MPKQKLSSQVQQKYDTRGKTEQETETVQASEKN